MDWRALFRFRPEPKRPLAPRLSHGGADVVPCTVQGVYADIHFEGQRSLQTGPPIAVRIDCEMTFYDMIIDPMPFGAQPIGVTLHLGVHAVELQLLEADKTYKGSRLTTIVPVQMGELTRIGGPTPEWARQG